MIANDCRISIIVPFYNVELYFRQFLKSLLPIEKYCEVILVDDGSKDTSRDIAEEFCAVHENVKLLTKENGGLSSARNHGLNIASGEYVIFFDSDDYIEDKSVIYKIFEKGKSNNADIIVAPYYEFSDLNKKKNRLDRVNFDLDLVSLDDRLNKLMENDISFAVWNKMFKTDFLKKNNLTFKEGIWFEDLEFIFRAFYFANKISKVTEILIGYRQRPGSIMKTVSPKIFDKISVLNHLYIFLEEQQVLSRFYELFKILYIRMTFSVFYSVLMNNGKNEDKQSIIDKLFGAEIFKSILKEKLRFKMKLTGAERILYSLIKNKIINRNNIIHLGYLRFLKSR